ncbi:hypothetical protein SAMN05660337_0291 [Maridesulfovibrio ferrireducens]|uniref:Flagellar motility protein MotE, a chaperone for MotC folding n=1 Tax=Maridesulfovibrio ferrireducens TaxID=246191 RepID=A0A1G9BH13_9BACT|nr:hypothetical protein [Maridesulfovibrio ferrireducens]SDK38791.1 hypothetical protein SAMN05660337_0291 [Maridesulfovibrio ferrireducens]
MTKWQRFGSSLRLSKILVCLVLLAFLKLSLIGALGFDLETPAKNVVEAVIESSVVRDAVSAPEAIAAEAKDKPAAESASKVDKRPERMPEADWKALKSKEDELARKERSLRTLEKNLDKKLAELNSLETRLKKMLADADVLKDQKIKHLVGVYTAMKPKSAALVIESLDTRLAVKILSGMRGRNAGEILGFVAPKKAATLSEELTKLQVPLGN